MALPKKNHSTSHMRRFRVKYRRRRECKTNYRKRTKLISQYKNKYSTLKYRLVVRKTNRDIVCQVFSSDMTHDKCLASAYSHELKRYGIPCGYTNYAAAYCTGLLLARRVNTKLDKNFEGVTEVNGEFFLQEKEDNKDGAFKVFLDTGLARCTTGANVFGVLKGAVDGGLYIPHNTKRFPGSTIEKGTDGKNQPEYDPEKHRERIFGLHVAEYMRTLASENPERYNKQFSKFIEAKIAADDVESMYRKAHEKIRENPNLERSDLERGYFQPEREKPKSTCGTQKPKKYNKRKLTGAEKKQRALKKLEEIKEKQGEL